MTGFGRSHFYPAVFVPIRSRVSYLAHTNLLVYHKCSYDCGILAHLSLSTGKVLLGAIITRTYVSKVSTIICRNGLGPMDEESNAADQSHNNPPPRLSERHCSIRFLETMSRRFGFLNMNSFCLRQTPIPRVAVGGQWAPAVDQPISKLSLDSPLILKSLLSDIFFRADSLE
ncbi:hypothetical protein BDV12DRAFT_156201 [Aspergillus spectabilis]